MDSCRALGLAWRLDDQSVLRAGYGRVHRARLAGQHRARHAGRNRPGRIHADDGGSAAAGRRSAVVSRESVSAGPRSDHRQEVRPVHQPRQRGIGRTSIEQRTPISDRFNVSFQRQLPGKFIVDVTYFINFVSRDQYSLNLNMMDPRLSYKYGSALTPDRQQSVLQLRNAGDVSGHGAPQCQDSQRFDPSGALSAVWRHHADRNGFEKAALPIVPTPRAARVRPWVFVPGDLCLCSDQVPMVLRPAGSSTTTS